MATRPQTRRVVRRTTPADPPAPRLAPAGAGVSLEARLQLEYLGIDEVTPYDFNPRHNEKAIAAVASSIRQFGFLVPCVVDADNILVCGHTRHAAARLIGMQDIPCLRASYLSPEQINAFRLIDNKVAELAEWDHEMLAGEIGKLQGLGLDFTHFGWRQEEIDCLSEVVSADCLTQSILPDEETQRMAAQRRAPVTTRIVIGEMTFFIPAAMYRSWADGIRQLCQFNEDAITIELKRRLGIPIV